MVNPNYGHSLSLMKVYHRLVRKRLLMLYVILKPLKIQRRRELTTITIHNKLVNFDHFNKHILNYHFSIETLCYKSSMIR